jgi:signal peptidase I
MILNSQELMPIICAALKRGQRVRLTVNGTSMIPFIFDGNVVELEFTPAPRLGDLVLVKTDQNRYVLHRIVRVDSGSRFFIRGDAQLHSDGPFAQDAILGRVTTVWRKDRALALYKGLWRQAGLAWIRTSPMGVFLIQILMSQWHLARRAQRWLQRIWKQI